MYNVKPEIRENETFLRYHEILRANPSSVVFAPLAELLILHGCYEEAITVCKKGLDKNPELVSGRTALARAYVKVANHKRAREEAEIVASIYPNHPDALEIINICDKHTKRKVEDESGTFGDDRESDADVEIRPDVEAHWNTVTMAEIFVSQGNMTKAKNIYNKILEREPENTRAKEGLLKLEDSWKS